MAFELLAEVIISSVWYLSWACERKLAGVAPANVSVEITPVFLSSPFAISTRFVKLFPNTSFPILLLVTFTPVDIAVPPAAESVYVVILPLERLAPLPY